MAVKNFEIRTEPHTATIGAHELRFLPEVVGSKFVQAYDEMTAVQRKLKGASGNKASSSKHAKEEDAIDGVVLAEINAAMIRFVRSFLFDDESRTVFDALALPDRILVQLIEWVGELYGGGSGNPVAGGGTSTG